MFIRYRVVYLRFKALGKVWRLLIFLRLNYFIFLWGKYLFRNVEEDTSYIIYN